MDVEAKVKAFLEGKYLDKGNTLSHNEPLLDSGLLDSTAIVELVTFLEDEFGIQIQDDEVVPAHFESINSIATFVTSKRRG